MKGKTRGPVTVIRVESSVEGPRTRRLEPSITRPDGTVHDGEEARLLRYAGPDLRTLIVAALSTGCRLGELLSLQWLQIRRDEQGQVRWIVPPAAKTKTAEARIIPIGPRFRAELEMRAAALRVAFELKNDDELPGAAHVFGNEIGEPLKRSTIHDAWTRTCHATNISDLNFHDLRREFASRLLESHADLHDVQMFLGHAAITTTSRYLQSTPVRLERALARLEQTTGGFAHDSHKATFGVAAEARVGRVEKVANSLN